MRMINWLVRAFNRIAAALFGCVAHDADRGTLSRRVWLSWQNLREDAKGRPRGFPWYGRAWLSVNTRRRSITLTWEWCVPSTRCALSFGLGGEGELKWSAALPPVSLFWGVEGLLPHPMHYGAEIDTSVRIFDGAIWWNLWRDDSGRDRSVPKWRSGNFRPVDLLLGKHTYSEETLSGHDVVIPMPEGAYPATVRLFESTWSRPRGFARRLVRADVKLKDKKFIPFPGKGENSWDCGEDGCSGICGPAKTTEEAVAMMVESVLRSRRRYGGSAMLVYPPPSVVA